MRPCNLPYDNTTCPYRGHKCCSDCGKPCADRCQNRPEACRQCGEFAATYELDGKEIMTRRKRLKLSRETFGNLVGETGHFVRRLEENRKELSTAELAEVCRVLDCTHEDLKKKGARAGRQPQHEQNNTSGSSIADYLQKCKEAVWNAGP